MSAALNPMPPITIHDKPKVLPGFEHMRRFWDPTHGCMTVKVLPGEFYVSEQEEMVSTVLGSCVSPRAYAMASVALVA